MTFAPASILAVRKLIQVHVPQLTNVALGIVGSRSTTSYHLGRGDVAPSAYSVTESARDRNGLSEAASALDIGSFTITVKGKKWTLRDLSVWLVAECTAGAADTADIREIIYSPDGKVVKRWDRLKIRSSGDESHLTHTHISWFRDSEGRNKAGVFERWFKHIGAIEEDDVPLTDAEIDKIAARVWAYKIQDPYAGSDPKRLLPASSWLKYSTSRGQVSRVETALSALTAAVTALGSPDVTAEELRQAIVDAIGGILDKGTAE